MNDNFRASQREALEIQRRREERERQDLLRRDLRDKYIHPAVPEAVSDRVFETAWEHGHASGNHEVEMFYESMKDAVNAAFRAGKQAGETSGANLALDRAAYRITAELICCDLYERLHEVPYEQWTREQKAERRSHSICWWGAAARGLVLDQKTA